MQGRRRQYKNRVAVTTNIEGSTLEQFRLISQQRHETLADLLDGWMHKYVEAHEAELYPKKLHDFNSDKPEAPKEEQPKVTHKLDINLDKMDKAALRRFIDQLEDDFTAKCQGYFKDGYQYSKQSVAKRKGTFRMTYRNLGTP